jgi:hypothetical protein
MEQLTTSIRSQQLPSDNHMSPNPTDRAIARNHGTSTALEATRERLEASKRAPIPTPAERIHELTKENGELRLEIRFYRQMQGAMKALQEDAEFVAEKLEQTILRFSRVQDEVERDWYEGMEGVH